jgi:hypothetical protein
MEVHPDFSDVLVLFNTHHVDYMIVRGYALAFYGMVGILPTYVADATV